jgi:hypothetical protein
MNLLLTLALLQTWQPKTPMVTPGWGMACATIGDRVYCIGGKFSRNDTLFPRLAVEAYDAAGDSWITDFADLPAAHCYAGCAVLDGKIYVVGGSDANRADLSRVDRFDPATNTWDTVPSLPSPRNALAACAFDGSVYVAGGLAQYDAYKKSVCRYAPGGAWEYTDSLNTPRANLGLVVADGRLNAVGGAYYSSLRSFEYYSGDSWTNDSRYMTTPRGGLAAVAHAGWIYAIGGYGQHGAMLSSVEYIDLQTGQWTSAMPITEPRAFHGAAAVGNRLIVIGGMDPQQDAIASVLVDSTLITTIDQTATRDPQTTRALPTITRGVLLLSSLAHGPSYLLDAAGRRVAQLQPGANDLGGLTQGVYFLHSPTTDRRSAAIPPARITIIR